MPGRERTPGRALTSSWPFGPLRDMFREFNAVQLRVALSGIEPVVWRRLVIPLGWHLGQLHLCIQAAFNWWNYHLHEFDVGGLRYGPPNDVGWASDLDPKVFDETGVRLSDFGRLEPVAIVYLYDFGDGWRHRVEFERLLALEVEPRAANCVDGARARPPEDVGGVGGYQRFLDVMADPSDPEHAVLKRWCGGHFDPEWFDLARTDKDVRAALKLNVRRRLHQPRAGR